MVFAALYNHEKREEGRAKGRAEANAAWRAWNARRLAAEAKGEPFTEPTPDAIDSSASGTSDPAAQTPT